MTEYIERRAAHDAVVDAIWHGKRSMYSVANAINSVPNADVVPVRHGRWEWFEEWYPSTPDSPIECEDCGWRCSECQTALEDMVYGIFDDPYDVPKLKFCPNCGAKMDLEDAE